MELLTFQRIGSSRDTLPWPGSYLLHKTALTLYLNHYANCCLILFSSKKLKTQTSSKIGDHSFLLLLRMCMKYFIYILYIFHDCEKHNPPISNAERRLHHRLIFSEATVKASGWNAAQQSKDSALQLQILFAHPQVLVKQEEFNFSY